MSKGILVVGPSRSGTSAITRTLNLLGAALPSNLAPPADHNPTGFWESTSIVNMHSYVLHLHNVWWGSFQNTLPEEWEKGFGVHTIRENIPHILSSIWDKPLWVVKDPRLCRTIPMWKALDKPLVVIIAARHPSETIQSIEKTSTGVDCLEFWTRMMESALDNTVTFPRCVVRYERLLEDWESEIENVIQSLDLKLTINGETRWKVNQFLNPSLRHFKPTSDPLPTKTQEVWDRVTSLETVRTK